MSNPIQQTLAEAKQFVLNGQLGKAIRMMQEVYEQRPTLYGRETLERIHQDHRLMLDFMLRGYKDDEREAVYTKLLHRLYTVVADLEIAWRCKNVSTFANAFRRADHLNLSPNFIQEVLERFVSDVTILSLDDEDTARTKSRAIHERHHAFMDRIFCAIFTSCQWSNGEANDFERIILLPTIETSDAAHIVSAITLSAINQPDMAKTTLLAHVYRETQEPELRQRALVGFVFSLCECQLLHHQQQAILKELLNKEGFENDLADLQKQIVFCMNAERDHEEIERDIMPSIIKHSNVRVTRFGIEEKEADALEDILHPDAEDKAMEEMESSITKMRNMIMAGSDVYFGGFKMMKRFPFFSELSNWFAPFSIDHPALTAVREKLDQTGFLRVLFTQGAFCESDKYSLALAMAQVFDRMPASIREMLGSKIMDEEVEVMSPSSDPDILCRRLYLQDLYRFFRIYPNRSELVDVFAPFDKKAPSPLSTTNISPAFFLLNKVFDAPAFNDTRLNVARFLHRKRCMGPLVQLISSFETDSAEYALIKGLALAGEQNFKAAYEAFNQALLRLDDQNSDGLRQRALKGKGHAAMRLAHYDEAEKIYRELHQQYPDDINFVLNLAIILTEQGRFHDATDLLFKIIYEHPAHVNTMRVLAWALMADGKLEQAENYYQKLLAGEPTAADYLNAGYSAWGVGRTQEAADRFAKYSDAPLADAFLRDERMLKSLGLKAIDIQLMLEAVE